VAGGPEREGRWECCIGGGGESAGEGGAVGVLEREGWWKYWRDSVASNLVRCQTKSGASPRSLSKQPLPKQE
jgi:hypothetical protein